MVLYFYFKNKVRCATEDELLEVVGYLGGLLVVGFEIGQRIVDEMRPFPSRIQRGYRPPQLEHANSISTKTSSVNMSASTLRDTPCSAINITNAQVDASVYDRAPEHQNTKGLGYFADSMAQYISSPTSNSPIRDFERSLRYA